jgi:hypothetical protein
MKRVILGLLDFTSISFWFTETEKRYLFAFLEALKGEFEISLAYM